MPLLSRVQPPITSGRILFRDAGFKPVLTGNKIKLGPGQMAAVGFGRYADAKYDLGIQEDVRIPLSIRPVAAQFQPAESNAIMATTAPPEEGDLRIILQQRGKDGRLMRSWPGGPPDGVPCGQSSCVAGDTGREEHSDRDQLRQDDLEWVVVGRG